MDICPMCNGEFVSDYWGYCDACLEPSTMFCDEHGEYEIDADSDAIPSCTFC